MISRTSYCSDCAKAGKPHKGDKFLLYKGKEKVYRLYTCETNAKSGYVPHLFEFVRTEQGSVLVKSYCSMCGCGVDVIDGKVVFLDFNVQRLSLSDWLALEDRWRFNTGYYI